MPLSAIHPLLILSGAAALIYQVVWVRLLGLSISSTSASVSIVVGTFFIGMAVGSELTTRLKCLSNNYFRNYIIAEALIALSALLLLPLLINLDQLVVSIPFIGQHYFTKICLVTLLLIIPTTCIGASFPLLVNARSQKESGKNNLGLFYGVSTLGAVAGALAVGFVLISLWGLNGAIYVAAALNILVILIAIYNKNVFTVSGQQSDDANQSLKLYSTVLTVNQKKLLIILFITGFVSLSCEVVWTKYLSLLTHTTIYGFSAILGIFLTGISLGAIILNRYFNKIKNPSTFLLYILVSLSLALIASRVALEYLPSLINTISGPTNTESSNAVKYLLIALIIAVPTLLFGACFSLCLDLICNDGSDRTFLVGRVYAINTVGSIFGVLLTGLWFIPSWGSDAALMVGVVLIIICPFFIVKQTQLTPWLLAVTFSLTFAANILLPHLEYNKMISSSLYYFDRTETIREPSYLFVKEGQNGVVSVSTFDNKLYLLKKNNLTEAAIYPADIFTWRSETLLAMLPYFISDNPQNAFIVGLGAGTTLSAAVLTQLSSIDVVEMDPIIEEANNYIYHSGLTALSNPKVNYYIDDARHRLLLQNKQYDIIISQPSHPWLSGNAHLFTQEYFQIAKSRLTENGIYAQWLNLFNLDASTLMSIFRSMYNVFPYGINFKIQEEGSLLLLASNQPISFDHMKINQKMDEPAIKEILAKWNIHSANDLLNYFSLSRAEANRAAMDSRPNTDNNLISEIRLANIKRFPKGQENPLKFINKNFNFDIANYLPIEKRQITMNSTRDYFARRGDRHHQTMLQKQIYQHR